MLHSVNIWNHLDVNISVNFIAIRQYPSFSDLHLFSYYLLCHFFYNFVGFHQDSTVVSGSGCPRHSNWSLQIIPWSEHQWIFILIWLRLRATDQILAAIFINRDSRLFAQSSIIITFFCQIFFTQWWEDINIEIFIVPWWGSSIFINRDHWFQTLPSAPCFTVLIHRQYGFQTGPLVVIFRTPAGVGIGVLRDLAWTWAETMIKLAVGDRPS